MLHALVGQLAVGLAVLGAEPRPGDVNADGLADYNDVVEHLRHWGPCEMEPCRADLDGDGFVDLSDLLWLLAELDHTPLMVAAPVAHRSA